MVPLTGFAGAARCAGLEALATLLNTIVATAESEKPVAARLRAASAMWSEAGAAVGTVETKFPTLVENLMGGWDSTTDAPLFKEASEATRASLATASSIMIGGGSPSEGGALPAALMNLATTIEMNAQSIATQAPALQREIASLVAAPARSLLLPQRLPQLQEAVAALGLVLDRQAADYPPVAQHLRSAGGQLNWVGPGGETATGPSPRPSTAAPTGPGGGPSSPETGQPGGGPAGGPAGQVPGAGGPGQEGAGAGAEAGGAGEGMPPQGPGLAGGAGTLPTAPTPVTPIDPAKISPIGPPPPSGLGTVPFTPTSPAAGPGSRIPSGIGNPKGIGSIGGAGGSKLGDLGGVKPVQTAGRADQMIAQAAKPVSAPQVGSGQAPAAPAGTTGGSAAQSSGSGVPPMMPPGAMGGAGGGGRGTKPGSGAVRPIGRERNRNTGPTPGIPAGLRGKTGKAGDAFPAVPAATRKRVEQDPVDTLQLLDEELWTVETTDPVAAQPQRRRLAH